MNLVEITDRQAWDEYVSAHIWGHPLQLWGWGEAKRSNGWTAHRLALVDDEGAGSGRWMGAAQVLLWPIPRMGWFIAYMPRGPVVDPGSEAAKRLLEAVVAWAKEHRALYVRVEPAWRAWKPSKGWIRAKHHLQLAETYTIDLRKPEDVLQEPMSRKHRQYIRKSERDGVTVRRETGADLEAMYQIYGETAERAGFGIHPREYYEAQHRELGEGSWLYYAEFEGRPVAFLWLGAAGRMAYELYGGVTSAGADAKANYALKWRAMTDLKAAGYEVYDFNGRLNEGVSQFKQGFGPDETDYVGTWDYPIGRAGYQMWEHLWPVVKVVGRRVARLRRG